MGRPRSRAAPWPLVPFAWCRSPSRYTTSSRSSHKRITPSLAHELPFTPAIVSTPGEVTMAESVFGVLFLAALVGPVLTVIGGVALLALPINHSPRPFVATKRLVAHP